MKLSVVVPALNEEGWLPAAAASVRDGARGAKLCRRLGRLELVPLSVAASARRFQRGGVAMVFAVDVALWLAGLLRLPVDRLGGALYWAPNRRFDAQRARRARTR